MWVRIASRYSDWLRAGQSGDRIPVKARTSATGRWGGTSPLYNVYRVDPGNKADGEWC